MPQAKQQTRQEHSLIYQLTGCLKSYEAKRHTKTHPLTRLCKTEGQDTDTTSRAWVPIPHTKNPLDKPYPQGGRHHKQEEP